MLLEMAGELVEEAVSFYEAYENMQMVIGLAKSMRRFFSHMLRQGRKLWARFSRHLAGFSFSGIIVSSLE